MAQLTRIDTVELQAAVQSATQKIEEAFEILKPYLVVMDAADRATTPRVRDGFFRAARSLCRALGDYPGIATAAGMEPAAVIEDLDNVKAIEPVVERMGELSQRLSDSRLVWLAEAWTPALIAYGVAKAAATSNPALRTIVAPLAEIFATRRNRTEDPVETPA